MSDNLGAAPYSAPPPLSLWERVCALFASARSWLALRRERIEREKRIEEIWKTVRLTARVIRIP